MKKAQKTAESFEKTAKKPMKLKTSKMEAAKEFAVKNLSKREIKALAWVKALKDIAENCKMPKFDLKSEAKKVIQRTISNFKGYRRAENGQIESFTIDACESDYAMRPFHSDLSYEILEKYRTNFIGYQNCAILRQNPIVDKCCTMPARDAMSSGYKVMYADDGKKAKLGELESFVERSQEDYQIQDVCIRAEINSKQFGWALVVPTFNIEVDMEKEFDIGAIPRDSYTGMTVIDPYWITYDFDQESLTDPTSKFFYQPTWYSFPTGTKYKRIHRSWCIKLINSPVADFLKPTYFFGGVSLAQQIYEAVYAYEKALNEAMLLLLTKRSYVADAEMSNYMANPQEVNAILEATSEIHSNYGIWVKQIGSEVKQMDTALTGLEEVINACAQRICAIANIRAEKLFNMSIKGLNSSGTFELSDYKQYLKRLQKDDYLPIINRHNILMSKSEKGKVKKMIVEFNPIDTPDELTKAKIREIDARTASMRLGGKITDIKEERIHLITDPNGGFSTLDPEPPIISKEQKEAFSVEKDNMGRPTPKEIDNPVRGKTKDDVLRREDSDAEEDDEDNPDETEE